MQARQLFESPLVTIREVACSAARGGDGGPEWSEAATIAFPLRGCYAVERARHTVVADTNTAVFFDVGAPYRVSHPADDGDVTLAVTCEPGTIADALQANAPTNAALHFDVQLELRLLRHNLAAGADPLRAEEQTLAIVARIAGTASPRLTSKRHRAVERAKAFLGRHFRDRILLADVARAADISPFGLARAFPAATGTTLHRYLLGLRQAAALDAIATGATDLARVAVDAGFSHHSHLTKTFVRTFDATPSELRRRFLSCVAVR